MAFPEGHSSFAHVTRFATDYSINEPSTQHCFISLLRAGIFTSETKINQSKAKAKMKQLKFFLPFFLTALLFTACKKDATETPKPSPFKVEGTYVGKIGTSSQIPNDYFEFKLKPGGAMERIGLLGGVDGTGTWTLTENNFAAEYKNSTATVTVTLTGTLNKDQKRISGNWSSTNGKSGTYHATQN